VGETEYKICDYGCGLEGKFLKKNGKMCCSLSINSCKGFVKKVSESLKKGYANGRKCSFSGKSWNKGKTKNSDERIAKASLKIKNQFLYEGRIPSFKGKKHTKEVKEKLSKNGGYKQGSSRGKRGWYKGYWCDSSWELAWIIYNLDHGIKFERNKQGFEYEFEGKKHKFYPDFILEDGTYVEIKAVLDDKNKAKISSFVGKLILVTKKEISCFLDYVVLKHGKEFINLYTGNFNKDRRVFCSICGKEISRQASMCPSCAGKRLLKRKVINRPSKKELGKLKKEFPMTTIGKMFGVSDSAIRKWMKR